MSREEQHTPAAPESFQIVIQALVFDPCRDVCRCEFWELTELGKESAEVGEIASNDFVTVAFG